MKTTSTFLLSALALGASSFLAIAQDEKKDGPPPGGPGGPGNRPMPPLIVALDANKDGEIDATEIANASAALKSLDKNGDGKLTADEIRPPRGPGGPGGPEGDRRRRDGDKPREKKDGDKPVEKK